ncbi:MAG TPA: PAS domain S-box protein [Allosphingosinicella sp.]|nr:PAS domain S-box protein [Allosphingosinicella sp.]
MSPALKPAQAFTPTGPELLELIADGIVSTDDGGRIILFNRAAESMFGYSRVEVLGRPVEILLPQRARGAHREAVAAFATSSAVGNRMMGALREVIGRRKDGSDFPAEASLSRRHADGRTVLTVVIRDVTERKLAEEQRLILSRELAHRFKNMMAVVNSILSLTARNAPTKEALVTSLRGRLATLARTHEMLLGSDTESADLRSLLEGELSPYRIHGASNVRLIGDPCNLLGPQVVNVALAVHELATNAAKYGALSRAAGQVEVRWSAEGGILNLHWRETGGPAVSEPKGGGFGTELIRRLLGAGVRLDYRKEGLEAWLRINAIR